MKHPRLVLALALVAVCGILVSADLLVIKYHVDAGTEGYRSHCNLSAEVNCDRVAASEWSTLFGVPIAAFGMLFYALVVMLAVQVRWRIGNYYPRAIELIAWLGVASMLYSALLAWVSHAVIGTFCLMCMALYAVNLALTVLAFWASETSIVKGLVFLFKDLREYCSVPYRVLSLVFAAAAAASALYYTSAAEAFRKPPTVENLTQNLSEIDPPVSLDGPIFGNKDGKVTLAVFSDFECTHCKALDEGLRSLVVRIPDLKVVHKDFPLDNACNPSLKQPNNLWACKAAIMSRCADNQGKFLEFSKEVFNNQGSLDETKMRKWAAEIGLDMNRLNACMSSEQTEKAIRSDIDEGIRIGIPGTPVVVVDGKYLYNGGADALVMEQLVLKRLEVLSSRM